MMRYFDMKRYPRERRRKLTHYFGGAIIQGGRLFEGGLLFKEIRYIKVENMNQSKENKQNEFE